MTRARRGGGTGPRSGAGTEHTSNQSKVAGSGYIFGYAEVAERGNGSPLGGGDGTNLQSVEGGGVGIYLQSVEGGGEGDTPSVSWTWQRGGTGPRSGARTGHTSSQSGEVESGCTFGQLRVAAMGYAFGQLKVAGRGGTGPRSGAGTERTSNQSKEVESGYTFSQLRVAGSGYIFGLTEVVGMGLTGC